MPPVALEPATPASDRQQSLALDRSATGIGTTCIQVSYNVVFHIAH